MADTKKDDEIVRIAKERFQRAMDFEGDFRKLFTDDLKFCHADSDNGYQWPETMRNRRTEDAKPCLTINKTRQHALMVINEAKENKPSVRVSAVGGEASYESAQVLEGVIRHIEYQSNAADAYDTALEFQVEGGIGYWRVVTDYVNDNSFDQELFIRRIRNPLSVVLDCDSRETDGSDSKWGFVFDDMPRADFNRKHAEWKDRVGDASFGDSNGWLGEDTVRVAEYYYVDYKKDTLIALPTPGADGQPVISEVMLSVLRESMPDLAKIAMEDSSIRKREVQQPAWKWCKIAGDQIIERGEWVGTTIPIVRVVGEEMIIDGKLDRKGHVRNLKDPQRMYNYWSSSAVEHVALQTKTPYVAGARSIEGYESYWETANTENHAYLPFNDVDDQGNPLPVPQRIEPPVMSQAYIQGQMSAAEEFKMASGQNDPLMGAPSNEISGVAISRRAKQSDRSTMHFRDNLAKAVRYTGKILVDVIPKIYDTPRVIRILAEDGSDDTVQIDPGLDQAMTEQPKPQGEGVDRIFNPAVGQYEVVADTGPSYVSKRDEAFEALSMLAAADPSFMATAGDLYFKTAPFPMADELAERFRNVIPANVRGEGPSPEVQQATQQIEQLQAQLAAALQAAADNEQKYHDKEKENEIKAFEATTKRLDAFMDRLGPLEAAMVALNSVQAANDQPSPLPEQEMPLDLPSLQQELAPQQEIQQFVQ
jgi:hypothetical protein